jgi:hypothetical protein
MKPSLYIETTIIGYLTSRVSNLLVAAANQQITRDWWDDHRGDFEVFISRFVVDECAAGDREGAAERLERIKGIPLLNVTDEVVRLADILLVGVPLPRKAQVDAYHVAVATVNGVQYLLTWNCKHIANASLRPRIERVCREFGYEPPCICTPQEIMET